MSIKFQLTGVREFERSMEKIGERYVDALGAAIYQEALALDAAMVKRIPVDTGRLRATHYAAPPVRVGTEFVCEVGTGTDYGPAVHELHKTGKKFLENAVNERASGYDERLARRTKQNAQRGVGVQALASLAPTQPNDPGDLHGVAEMFGAAKRGVGKAKKKTGR